MLRAALIGLPSSGKTTLFQLMTSAKEAPRGKGDVNIGISKVPDTRLDILTGMYNPKKRVPATVEFTDIIGPAKTGAQALVDVAGYKNADALVHVVRAFRDAAVPHASGAIDPARDAQAMEDELILADLGVVERRLERLEKDLKKGRSPELEKERDLVQRCKVALEEGKPLRALQLTGDDLKRLRGFQFLSAKPLLLVINLDESDIADVAAGIEAAAAHVGPHRVSRQRRHESRRPLREDRTRDRPARGRRCESVSLGSGLSESGLDRVIRTTYELLGYMSFFTVGEDECRAWSIARGTAAQAAAGEIHSDIQRGFIRAEVVAYDALTGRGSMATCRDHGEVRLEGKEYVVQDGDIINFRFAT
jgi:GTP-binding protein YchF